MRVTAKNQIYAGPGSASKNNWIVRKQKLHLVRAASSQRQRKILLAHHGVVNAGKPKRAPVQFETHSFVYKDTNSFSPKKISNKGGVGPMIMVAQDCKNPIPGAESTHQFGTGGGIVPFMGDVVARERDNIRFEAVGGLDRAFYLLCSCKWTVVYIGELDNSKSIQFDRQAFEFDRRSLDSQHKRLRQCPAGSLCKTGSNRPQRRRLRSKPF